MIRLLTMGILVSVFAAAACGNTRKVGELPGGAGGEGGEGSADEGAQCEIDPPGEDFVFRVVNRSDGAISLNGGCFDYIPFELERDGAREAMAAEVIAACGYTCNSTYAGDRYAGGACSDCGGGSLPTILEPDDSLAYTWDRRTYVAHTASAECSGHEDDNFCALGTLVDANTNGAVLLYQRVEPGSDEGSGDTIELSFDFSLDEGEAEVEVD